MPSAGNKASLLHKAQQKYEQLVASIDGIVWEIDPRMVQFSFVSPQAERLLGYPLEQWYKPGFWMGHLHPDDRERALELGLRAIRDKRSHDVEFRMLDVDGRTVWLRDVLSVVAEGDGDAAIGLRGVMVDITERKRAEEALKESEHKLREAQRIAHLGHWDRDLDADRITWSDETYRIFGLRPQERIINLAHLRELIHPDDRQIMVDAVADAIRGGSRYDVEYRVVRPNGEVRFVHSQGEVTTDQSGRPRHMFGTALDITERKRAEEQSRRLQDELAHVTRVNTMGEMATGIAHEINQPLAAITNFVYAARLKLQGDQSAEGGPLSTFLRQIEEEAIRAGEIVKRLRHFVQKRMPDRSSVNLNELIGATLAMVRRDAKLGEIELTCQFDPALPPVTADGIQIQQVLLNLLRNAMEAVAGMELARRRIVIASAAPHPDAVEVAVQDFGPGLSPGALSQVFDAFNSTKPNGLGMGLAISRRIVEAHNGRLWVDSRIGEGATFRFSLPISTE